MQNRQRPIASIEEIAGILSQHPIFARFDRQSLLAIAARCEVADFRGGETIMRQGEPGDFAYVILDGEVDIFVEIPAGRIQLATVGQHRIVGELGAFTDMPRTATVLANSDVAGLRIGQRSLIKLVAEYPAIAFTLIGELGRRLHSMNQPLAYLTYAASALERDEYDDAMLSELTEQPGELGNFARVFANMAAEIRQKQRRREEMRAAAEIQESILPGPLPHTGATSAIDLHALMHPAREIGGDFYDYFLLDDDHLAITIADVSGKGIPAALFMAVSRTVLRSVTGHGALSARMAEANRLLALDNKASMFATLFHAVLDLATGALRYCNAGHNPPYLLRADGGRDTLQRTGIPFGVDADEVYRIEAALLAPGDTLFLFTDGITEAFNAASEAYGEARLQAALEAGRGTSAAELVDRVLADTATFAADAEQSDDITCLALRFRP
jgi:sigma-B regulation protein RsbU (phosphoserine phosphatase)